MSRPGDLDHVAGRLAALLGPEDCLLVGGLAVAAHGHVRATEEVDLVSRLPPRAVRDRLRRHRVACDLLEADPLEGDFACVHGTLDGIPFHVLPEIVPLDWDRAIALRTREGARLKVVDLDGLMRLKLHAGGPQDLVDVAMLVLLHPSAQDRALDLASAQGSGAILARWLDDPRLRARARRGRRPGRRRRRSTRDADSG